MTAKEVLEKYWDGRTVPVPVRGIAAQMGVSVLSEPQMTVSGHYSPMDSRLGTALISVRPTESALRQQFTVAHELAHHCLAHGERDRLAPPDFTTNPQDPIEDAANRFAMELLMPEQVLRAFVEAGDLRSVAKLALRFGVGEQAMFHRLKELGYAFR